MVFPLYHPTTILEEFYLDRDLLYYIYGWRAAVLGWADTFPLLLYPVNRPPSTETRGALVMAGLHGDEPAPFPPSTAS